MAPSLVQSAFTSQSASASPTVTIAATGGGNALIVGVVTGSSGVVPTVSGVTLGATSMTSAVSQASPATAGYGYIFYLSNIAGGQTTVTVTTTGGTGTLGNDVYVEEWSGMALTSMLDQISGTPHFNNSTSTGYTSNATGATTQAVEVAFGLVSSFSTTITAPAAPWVCTSVSANSTYGHQVLATAGSTPAFSNLTISGLSPPQVSLALAATFKAFVSPLTSWTGSYARDPLSFTSIGAPGLAPTAIPVSNTAGDWLFAVASWRQDAGQVGVLQYPSTVTVSDDAANFWIPVYSTPAAPAAATGSLLQTGIVRSAVWMAPAARQAETVFVSPTAYQSSLVVQIFQIAGVCPWYQVEVVNGGFTNQGTSLSAVSVTPGSGVYAFGVVAYDNLSAGVTITSTGWTALGPLSAVNGSDHTGDMYQAPYELTGAGSSVSLSATSSSATDMTAVTVVVSGVTDVRPFPYAVALENWPVLITEIAAGPTLNKDPVFAQGATYWTGNNANATGVSWPLWSPIPDAYQPVLYGSLQVVPSGSSATSNVSSEAEAVSPVTQYSALAYVYSPAGFGEGGLGSGVYAGINFYTSGLSYITTVTPISNSVLLPGEWTQLTLNAGFPPPTAAFATLSITIVAASGATVPASAQFYIGYAALSVADAYEAVPPDQLAWYDISARVFTQGQVQITRGIQYEQQSLEAGTLTLHVANQDGLFNFGNVLSALWPNAGDTDVPVRMRSIWPGSVTPYSVLFSGYTDDIVYGIDSETYYGFAELQASDAWSRLTQQMLALVENEALTDNPVAFISCNQTGGNTISTGTWNNGVLSVLSSINQDMLITAPSATFAGGAINIAGASGLSCWQSSGTKAATTSGDGNIGYALAWPVSVPLPVTNGITVEFWWSGVSDATQQTANGVIVAAALATAGFGLAWVILAQNSTPANAFINYFTIQTFDVNGNTVSQVNVGTEITPYLTTATATANYYFVVSWNQSSITVTVNPGAGILGESVTLTSQSFVSTCGGFWWGGGLNVHGNYGDTAIADIAIYDYFMPPVRSATRYQAGLTAFASESDNWRLARVTGYSGFVPVLGMRGTDLAVPPAADVDMVTGATDTNTQVVSAYFTNVASSTLAALFVNGPGTLIYRRRNEWYNRPIGQYVLGELDNQQLSLNINPLNGYASTAGWTTGNSATLSPSIVSFPFAGGPLFVPYAGVFTGNGSVANPFIITTSNPAVTPGLFYQFTVWLYSPQGWTSGTTAEIQFFNASNVQVGSTISSAAANIAAGSIAYATTGATRAPAAAAYAKAVVQVSGTPASTVGFYVANAVIAQVTPDYAPGANVAVPEAPYSAGYQISSDRAQLYNYAILTQYGTNLVSSFSGTSVLFTPSSGVIVLVSNVPSIAQRGQIPYTATIYENNTAQATPYYLNEGSIEDVGSWITQTLGSPLLRPDQVTITPAATPSATQTGAIAEVGDTVVFRRRPLGSPEVQILTYISKLTHTIDISTGTWTVAYELSPFPGGAILTCDDVVHGVLTGQQQLGW